MAKPISFASPVRDRPKSPKADVQTASLEHAAAILSAYEVLQGLHDCGMLELLRGLLGSGSDVLNIAVDAANSPQSVSGMRNLLLLVKMLGAIDPEQLRALTLAVPESLAVIARRSEPPSLWELTRTLLGNKDARRGLSALQTFLETFGGNLGGAVQPRPNRDEVFQRE